MICMKISGRKKYVFNDKHYYKSKFVFLHFGETWTMIVINKFSNYICKIIQLIQCFMVTSLLLLGQHLPVELQAPFVLVFRFDLIEDISGPIEKSIPDLSLHSSIKIMIVYINVYISTNSGFTSSSHLSHAILQCLSQFLLAFSILIEKLIQGYVWIPSPILLYRN